jgi:CelD/BcsL family acetyltransferase involved in cellulose biosynthesis
MEDQTLPKDLELTCVTNEGRFKALAVEWNRLADAADASSVFLRHEWFEAVWSWLKQDCELLVLCVRRNGILLGICPLVRRQRKRRSLPVRAIEFLSVSDTQACDILADPEYYDEVVTTIASHFSANVKPWDLIVLDKLPERSLTPQRLQAAMVKCGMGSVLETSGADSIVPLQGTWDDYYMRRSRRLKKGNNLVANTLRRAHATVNLRWVRGKTTADAERALAAAIAISADSWKKTTGFSLDSPGPNAFIRLLTQHAQQKGWLSLWILELDSIPVAMEYQLIYRGHVHALRADFRNTHHNLSPGTYLNWKLLERLFASDLIAYHMGVGDNPYKGRWAEAFSTRSRLMVFGRTMRGRLLRQAETRLRPVVRHLCNRISPSRIG